MKLVAHKIAKADYEVLDDGQPVGRIRRAIERTPTVWVWHVQILLPIPAWCNGAAPDRATALVQFRDAWTRFKATIPAEKYAAVQAEAAAARARFS